MKNKFCTIFLYLFALDGILGIFVGVTTLYGSDLSQGILFRSFQEIFSFGIVVCAVVQIIISFVKKLRWSARIIGMYTIFYNILNIVIVFFYSFYWGIQGMTATEIQSFVLTSPFINSYIIMIGLIQIVLFFWALKDLSKGHYLTKG
ncbi:MAG: hypothetical protein B5M53_03375 [Candidatus Cloacimonas sp. 4484_209]|nr:MAG: hypothetical protein B5M53_03375 [Candidatus Cloacimonas sp. 4484_209]